MPSSETLWARCVFCREEWQMDYEPAPDGCSEHPWEIGVINWGAAVWPDGQQYVKGNEED